MRIVFATNNGYKIAELQAMLGNSFKLLSLHDIGCLEEIPEDQPTIEGNSRQKATYIYKKFGFPCFADDTALEIDALNGNPGVFSARYAGEKKDSDANMDKVLSQLKKINNRNARFRTVITLIINDKEILFEGIVTGEITKIKKGIKGFGYDPIFIPKGFDKTFAEMQPDEKNKISHRGKAVEKLVQYLKSI